MPHQTYSIPVIAADMRREETIHHICDALEQLEQVSSEIFSRICKRVEQNQAALKNINKRVDLAQAKISTLKGSHKATKVFSSAKYPNSSDSSHLYSSLHNGTNNVPHSYKERKIAARHKTVDEKTLKEKLQFFNVNIKTKREKSDLLQADYESEGLGRLPSHIDSVSSLLLFNTSENPYKKYVLLDPLGVVTKTRTTDADDSTALAEAPPTISEGEELHRQVNPGMFYTPAPGDVPEIAVPDFLPDLLGVADDLSYSADLGPSIAPSAPLTVPDLPELDMGGDDSALPQGPAGGGTAVVDSSISASALPPPPPAAPPPPPPPPPSTAPPPPPPSTVAPPPPPPSTVAPPPPPPGPPPPTLPAQVNQGDDIDTSKQPAPQTKKVVPDMDGGRSSLLDSIRKAGGVGKMKLRSAKERRLEDKKKKKEKSEMAATSGGDLMGDLSRALNLRRRGISGANKNSSDKGGDKPSAMDHISAMIPAPPPNAEPAEQSDEWD